MKRLIALLLLLVLLTGCGPGGEHPLPPDEHVVTLNYYTIGSEDRDLALVEKHLNQLLLERYGFRVRYHKIGWNDYLNHIDGMVNTTQEFDVIFTWGEHYLRNADRGLFLGLSAYLENEGLPLYDAVNPLFWTGVTVHGEIYGVPTNKETAAPIQLLFSQELVEKYRIDLSQYRSLDSLEPLFRMIAREEPDCIPLFFDSSRRDLMSMVGYEYLMGNDSPLMIRSDDPTATIVSLYETDDARRLLSTLHRYYKAGYINADAPLRTSVSRFEDEKVFCRIGSGGPDSSESFSVDYGYPIISVQASDAIVDNISTQGGIMAISSKTRHPREARQFLKAINTDPEVRNLLNFGVEDIHYRIDENDQVEMISDGYRGTPYTQGNWFILKTMAGERTDKWDHYRAFNEHARSSRLLGFVPDLGKCQDIYTAVCRISRQYETALMTGAINPNIYVPKLNKALKDAGIDQLIRTLQPQVDAWLAQNQQP